MTATTAGGAARRLWTGWTRPCTTKTARPPSPPCLAARRTYSVRLVPSPGGRFSRIRTSRCSPRAAPRIGRSRCASTGIHSRTSAFARRSLVDRSPGDLKTCSAASDRLGNDSPFAPALRVDEQERVRSATRISEGQGAAVCAGAVGRALRATLTGQQVPRDAAARADLPGVCEEDRRQGQHQDPAGPASTTAAVRRPLRG